MADLEEQWHGALGALTELALTRVTVVAMPPPNREGRVRAGFGATMSVTGTLGRMIEPTGRGRDVLQFPLGDPDRPGVVGHFGISRPAFRDDSGNHVRMTQRVETGIAWPEGALQG